MLLGFDGREKDPPLQLTRIQAGKIRVVYSLEQGLVLKVALLGHHGIEAEAASQLRTLVPWTKMVGQHTVRLFSPVERDIEHRLKVDGLVQQLVVPLDKHWPTKTPSSKAYKSG